VRTLIAFAIVLLAGFLGSTRLFKGLKKSPPFLYIFYSGTFYIIFGILIGENGLNLISYDILKDLIPIINFTLGWVGFIFGFQVERRFLKRIKFNWYITTLITYFFSMFVIFTISFIMLFYLFNNLGLNTREIIAISLILSILLSETSISFTVWSSKFFKKQVQEIRFLTFATSMDNFFPILLTGIIFSTYKYSPIKKTIIYNNLYKIFELLLLQIIIGMISGYLINLLVKNLENKLEVSTILFAFVFFLSGISMMLNLSPLFVLMLTGITFTNLTKKQNYFLKILSPTEKPIYIIFLTFLSIKKSYFSFIILIISLILIISKFHSKLISFKFLKIIFKREKFINSDLSYLLIPTGTIAPAIMLDIILGFPVSKSSIASGILILTILISEIISPTAIKIAKFKTKNDN